MGRVNQRYTRQYREEAMGLVRVKGYDVARAADLTHPAFFSHMLRVVTGTPNSRAGYGDGAEGQPPAPLAAPSEDPAHLRARVRELERQVKRLEMEKDILKKATPRPLCDSTALAEVHGVRVRVR